MDEKELIANLQTEVETLKQQLTTITETATKDKELINQQQADINAMKEKHTKYLEKLTHFENTNPELKENENLSLKELGQKLRKELEND
jgi:SMC interacting uncharacterized protein involved in chromosome segregation